MKKFLKKVIVPVLAVSLLTSACSNTSNLQKQNSIQDTTKPGTAGQDTNKTSTTSQVKTNTPVTLSPEELQRIKPNEDGKITVVMFHNFVESFTPTKYDDGAYTTTFNDFRSLLQNLYDKGYRLINLNDMLDNNISVPAGFIPIVFTFDDGTSGQFNLVEENGKLVASKQSAVGILEEFNRTHPDFGLKGTFYVNMGLAVFDGKGTVPERLKYLIDEGFEIGNHTLTHVHLNEVKTADKIIQEVGENQKKMLEAIPGYQFKSFALPFGQASKELQSNVVKGEFQGVKYENQAIMNVGWDPSVSPVSKSFNPLSIHRVRSSGIKPVDADLAWWLRNLSKNNQYISDGNPDTVTVPKAKADDIDNNKLKGKQLITY